MPNSLSIGEFKRIWEQNLGSCTEENSGAVEIIKMWISETETENKKEAFVATLKNHRALHLMEPIKDLITRLNA